MYKLLLCNRYLRTRYIALASIISVMLGVATMIVVNSVMAGFSSQMRDRIHNILADMVLEVNSTDGQPNAEADMEQIRKVAGEYIEAMSPTVEIYAMLSFQYVGQWITRPVTLIGIDPESKHKVGELKRHLGRYRPLMEGDKVIRPAEYALDVPADWNLTPSAREYHQLRQEQMRWRDRHDPVQDTAAELAAQDEAAEADEAGEQPTPEPRDVAQGDVAQADEAPVKFDNPDDAFPQERESESAPALLPGRIYIGESLISFMHEDPATHQQKMVMMVRPGDEFVKLSTVTAKQPPETVHFNAMVADIFKSGMSEYDSNLVFINLEYLQKMRGMDKPEPRYTTIQIKLKDYAYAEEVSRRLRAAFSPRIYSVRTWEEKQGPLLAAVAVESAILNVLLFLIIAVAGFGILAIFFMIVVEKTRDIGILKALGAGSGGVLTIFMSYGLALGIVGSGVGVLLGLVFVWNINWIESMLTWLTGHKIFDERIYYFPVIPTETRPFMVFWVAIGAIAIAVLASILPARRAARLHPVEALRYE